MVSMQEQIAAKAAGQEMGAYFGIKSIDEFVKGLRPTELMILGGDPGVGKSAIAWAMARNFAWRQMRKPVEKRIGVMVLSLEMGEELSSTRFAQMEAKIEGERLRTLGLTRAELREIALKWAANRELPLVVNHSGELRETQIKALVIDAIRRHKIGLVIIDHFRFIKTDERFEKATEADDQIVKFLKASLAKDLNLAVVCLAHTTKSESGRRPIMDDLRGSKMISAFADIVAFPYWPWKHASQEKRERGLIAREEYELIFDKVRQGAPGTGELWMDLSTMTVN
jgi:replicative DNA helicase